MKNPPWQVGQIKDLITGMRDGAKVRGDDAQKLLRIEQCAINAIRMVLENRDHWIKVVNADQE